MIVDELEKKLRAPEMELKPYPPKVIILASGEKMVVREVKREETEVLLETIYPLMGVMEDFYDIVAESPIGFRRWMIEYGLKNAGDCYPEIHHELGGVPTHILTKEIYDAVRDEKVTGTRPVDPEVLASADTLKAPDEYPQIPGFKRSKS